MPALSARFRSSPAAARGLRRAWTEAILRVLESSRYLSLPLHDDAWVAARLGISSSEVNRSVRVLRQAGPVRRASGRFVVRDASTVETRGDANRVEVLLSHWSAVAAARVPARRPRDLFAYNVFSLSPADYETADAGDE